MLSGFDTVSNVEIYKSLPVINFYSHLNNTMLLFVTRNACSQSKWVIISVRNTSLSAHPKRKITANFSILSDDLEDDGMDPADGLEWESEYSSLSLFLSKSLSLFFQNLSFSISKTNSTPFSLTVPDIQLSVH